MEDSMTLLEEWLRLQKLLKIKKNLQRKDRNLLKNDGNLSWDWMMGLNYLKV